VELDLKADTIESIVHVGSALLDERNFAPAATCCPDSSLFAQLSYYRCLFAKKRSAMDGKSHASLLLLLLCAWFGVGQAQLVISSGPTSAPGTYDPCLPPPSGVNIVSAPPRASPALCSLLFSLFSD
jgi:hypothetical protein